jgi:hypothetical protein
MSTFFNLIKCIIQSILVFGHELNGHLGVGDPTHSNVPLEDSELHFVLLTDVDCLVEALTVKQMTLQTHGYHTHVSCDAFWFVLSFLDSL